jgi:hypothetical protein
MAIMSRIRFHHLLFLGIVSTASAAGAPLTFEGRYEFRTDDESLDVLGNQVCFFPAERTSATVPRPAGDKRLPWFCFANSKSAAHMFGFKLAKHAKGCGVFGNALVSVSNYKRYAGEGDGNDIATLMTVSSTSPPKPLPCEK